MARHTLTMADAVALGAVVGAARRNAYVGRLMPETGDVMHGTARSIGTADGAFTGPNDDVREMYLRVTTSAGWEAFWPVSDLMAEVNTGTFVVDYEP